MPGLPGEQLGRMARHPLGLCWVFTSPLEETLTPRSPLQPKTRVRGRRESQSFFPEQGHPHRTQSRCLDVDNLAKVMARLPSLASGLEQAHSGQPRKGVQLEWRLEALSLSSLNGSKAPNLGHAEAEAQDTLVPLRSVEMSAPS